MPRSAHRYAPSLRSGPARRLLPLVPRASGATTGPSVHQARVIGPDRANSTAPFPAIEGPAARPGVPAKHPARPC